MEKIINFEDFLTLVNFNYRIVGIDLRGTSGGFFLQFMLFLTIINNVLVFILQIIFAIMNIRQNFIDASMSLCYIGYDIIGLIKIYYMWRKKSELSQFLISMKEIFPKTNRKQEQMNVRRHLRQCTIITSALTSIYMILIWTYNLYPLVHRQIYDCWLNERRIQKELPYFVYIPWSWRDNWSYYVLYFFQIVGAGQVTCAYIASDLVIYAMGTQIIMHYEHVSRTILEYQPKTSLYRRTKAAGTKDKTLNELIREENLERVAYYEDLKFVGDLIAYHSKILSLSDVMNDTFGIPLLVNFMASAFIICFIGFQMTMGIHLKLLMFFGASLVQIFLISHYGQLLIDASVNVAGAVFCHDWPDAHIHYQRMLVIVMARAQRPAMLKATNFVHISHGTMTDIIQISYKFFALVRTMYKN